MLKRTPEQVNQPKLIKTDESFINDEEKTIFQPLNSKKPLSSQNFSNLTFTDGQITLKKQEIMEKINESYKVFYQNTRNSIINSLKTIQKTNNLLIHEIQKISESKPKMVDKALSPIKFVADSDTSPIKPLLKDAKTGAEKEKFTLGQLKKTPISKRTRKMIKK